MMKKLTAMLLCLCMLLTLLPVGAMAEDTFKAIELGTSGIQDPTGTTTQWGKVQVPNSYVYFGVNGGSDNPIKWRVLDADKANDGTTSGMFLLSEHLLASGVAFDDDGYSNVYQGSGAQKWNSSFASNTSNFTFNEQSSMLGVAKNDMEGTFFNWPWGASSLTSSDKMFFLSAEELASYVGNYEYADGLKATDASGAAGEWWLRSPNSNNDRGAGDVNDGGTVGVYYVSYGWAARPAFNLRKR